MRVCYGARQRSPQRRHRCPTARRCDSGGAERALKIDVRKRELGLVGASRGNSEVDASHAGADLCTKLEELETDGLGGGIGELAMAQTDATQSVDQHIGHCRERHAQLIGRHRYRVWRRELGIIVVAIAILLHWCPVKK